MLRRHVAALSSSLSTPIPFFLGLPVKELQDWALAAQRPEKR